MRRWHMSRAFVCTSFSTASLVRHNLAWTNSNHQTSSPNNAPLVVDGWNVPVQNLRPQVHIHRIAVKINTDTLRRVDNNPPPSPPLRVTMSCCCWLKPIVPKVNSRHKTKQKKFLNGRWCCWHYYYGRAIPLYLTQRTSPRLNNSSAIQLLVVRVNVCTSS